MIYTLIMPKDLYLFVIIAILLLSQSAESACSKKWSAIVREGPSSHFERLKVIPKYTPLLIKEIDGNWFRVKGHDFEGWVFSKSVSAKANCMISIGINEPVCVGKRKTKTSRVSLNEGFKILKKELGCNFVQDRDGKRFWINSVGAWPKNQAKLISID